MKFLICNNASGLQAMNPHVTVEAEYGDLLTTGSILTMAHHGPRTGQPAPCSYPNNCAPGVEIVGLSHVDLDTIGGVMAILGCKPMTPNFWAVAEFVDLNGAHKLSQCPFTNAHTLRALNAYWAFSQSCRVYAPRDGSVLDVTEQVMKHVEAIRLILTETPCTPGIKPWRSEVDDLLEAGDAFKRGEEELNKSSFVRVTNGVIFRRATAFVNHLYTAPNGEIGKAVVTWNTGTDLAGGAITLSLADPIPGVNCAEILKGTFGPEAGGHAGIAGSPRGKALPEQEALALVETVAKLL